MKDNQTPKKQLRIALVSDAIYPYNVGGKEKRIYELTTRLAQKGYKVTIYCMKWWDSDESERVENGVTLKAISPLYPLYKGERRSIKQAALFALNTLKLIKEDFDILDADHMPHLILFPLKFVSLMKRKKFYVTWNEVWGKFYWLEYMGALGMIAYIIERLSVLLPDEFISVSNHTTSQLQNALHVKKPVHTVFNGIDFSAIEKISPAHEKSDIIFAGRFLSHKNIDMLVRAVAEVKKTNPSVRCFLIGNGPEEKKLKSLVKMLDLEDSIRFFDFLPNHDYLYALMKSSKVFVLPSEREGFGIVTLEANACGLPVVTIKHPHNAAKQLVTDVTGFVIKNDINTLAETIKHIIDEKKIFEKKEIINESEKYDWDKSALQLDSVYSL